MPRPRERARPVPRRPRIPLAPGGEIEEAGRGAVPQPPAAEVDPDPDPAFFVLQDIVLVVFSVAADSVRYRFRLDSRKDYMVAVGYYNSSRASSVSRIDKGSFVACVLNNSLYRRRIGAYDGDKSARDNDISEAYAYKFHLVTSIRYSVSVRVSFLCSF